MNLFAPIPNEDPAAQGARPLADRMRPRTLDEFVGQEHLVGPGKPLRVQIERDDPTSMIFWGPPGTGKTTLAKIIARITKADFIEFSAVLAGIKEIKQVMSDAERARQYGTRTIVFVDEIHRFNKAQQDAFLPHVEKGSIRLIGATTENPSFEINSALLTRCRVYVLKPLTEDEIVILLRRALTDPERGLGQMHLEASDESLRKIAAYSSGDARNAYNVLEVAASLSIENSVETRLAASPSGATEISEATIHEALQKRVLLYDKSGEEHYNIISALHKSNALYTAYGAVQQDVEQTAAEPVPLHLRNAPTSLMKGLGYGKDYQYAHDTENKVADMQCLPDSLRDRMYYRPTNEGVEKRIRERLEEIRRLKQPRSSRTSNPLTSRTKRESET